MVTGTPASGAGMGAAMGRFSVAGCGASGSGEFEEGAVADDAEIEFWLETGGAPGCIFAAARTTRWIPEWPCGSPMVNACAFIRTRQNASSMVQIQTRVLIGRNTFSVNVLAAVKVLAVVFWPAALASRQSRSTTLSYRGQRAHPCLTLRDSFSSVRFEMRVGGGTDHGLSMHRRLPGTNFSR